jgi:hypothetical protein
MLRCLSLALPLLLPLGQADAQQAAPTQPRQPVTGELIASGFEVKAVINNTYLILQKADKAFWCGSGDPSLTWANWPLLTREAICVPLNR